jgi:hypothetical protein
MLGCASAFLQSGLNGAAGGVGGMNDPPVAVAAFAVQVIVGAPSVLDSRVKGTPWALSHSITSRPCSTVKRTASAWHKPAPAIRVSCICDSMESPASNTAETPPCA